MAASTSPTSATGSIYHANANATALTPFITLPDGVRGNGLTITPDGQTLFVAGMGRDVGGVFSVNLLTRAISRLSVAEGIEIAADGLYLHEGDGRGAAMGRGVPRLSLRCR